MTGCPELRWQSGGQGVVIDDIDRVSRRVMKRIPVRKLTDCSFTRMVQLHVRIKL